MKFCRGTDGDGDLSCPGKERRQGSRDRLRDTAGQGTAGPGTAGPGTVDQGTAGPGTAVRGTAGPVLLEPRRA
jgi:hypothetical protein